MKGKRIVKWAAFVVLVGAIFACQSISSVISEPSLAFESVAVTGINFTGIDMKARIRIQNNNAFSLSFPEIAWKLFVTDAAFLDGVISNTTKIEARGSSFVELPFTVNYEGLYKTVSGLLSSDEAPYRIDLSARFPLPVLESKTFTASHSGSIPMFKAPSLSFNGVKFNSLSLNKVEFVLSWIVDNKNAFAVNLDKLDYSFAVNNVSWISGSAPRISLPARRTTQIPVTVNINSLSMIQDIVALAAGGKTANYTCGGEAVLIPQIGQSFPGLENAAALRLPFNYSGSTNLKP